MLFNLRKSWDLIHNSLRKQTRLFFVKSYSHQAELHNKLYFGLPDKTLRVQAQPWSQF